jgi:hypothetical protein
MDLLKAAVVLEERAREAHEWRMDSGHTMCRGVLGDCASRNCKEAVAIAAELRETVKASADAAVRYEMMLREPRPLPPLPSAFPVPPGTDLSAFKPAVAIDPSALDRAVGPSIEQPLQPRTRWHPDKFWTCDNADHKHRSSTSALGCLTADAAREEGGQ